MSPVRLPTSLAPRRTTRVDRARTVRRFAEDVVGPKVREMDENEMMDPEIVKALFDQGVCSVSSSPHP